MATLISDLRYALRQLARHPGFTLVAVSTLALGVGANTALFSVVHGVLLAPLAFPQAERLVSICETNEVTRGFCVASPPDVADWAAQSRTIERIGLARSWTFTLVDALGREGITGGYATPGYFAALGVRPAMGRLFAADEAGPDNGNVVVLGNAVWRSRFGADSGVIGRAITLDGRSYTVIGVLPADTHVPHLGMVQLWTALPFSPRDESNRHWRGFRVVGRLAPGASVADAARELGIIQQRLAVAHPVTNAGWGVAVSSLHESVVGNVRPTLMLLLGAVLLVLVIACVNVAGLTLARATGRAHEFAVCAALGAGRWPIVRRLLAEGWVLGVAGGGIGIAVAAWGIGVFTALAPPGIPRIDEVHIDVPVLAFAAGLSLLAALLATVLPAIRMARAAPAAVLRESGEGHVVGTRRRTRDLLVASEIGLALMLLVSALLLSRSFGRLLAWSPGFEQAHLLTFWSFLSDGDYPTAPSVVSAYGRATEALRGVPGVQAVGMTSAGPLFGGEETERFQIVGQEPGGGTARSVVRWFNVDPHYFEALGIPLRRGRAIAPTDVAGSPPVAVINTTMARRYWPDQDAVGHYVRLLDREQVVQVVGVVADIPPLTPGEPMRPELYLPFAQATRWASYFVVRTTADPASVAGPVRARLADAVPGMDLRDFATLPERLGRQLVHPRFTLVLVAAFALSALLLAAIGTYGAIAYLVARRTREIGVRIALGADRRRVIRLVVARGMVPVLTGVVVGVVAALATTGVIRSLLPGIGPRDPAAFGSAAIVLGAVGWLAAYLPAHRATRIDPMEALRHE
jgi:putative ABC transport system permease protein